MSTITTFQPNDYPEGTASMQVDPEALHTGGVASESFPAACADVPDIDWVPAHEESVVPHGMRRICDSCPGRINCLLWALRSGSEGYWAGTTTTDREQLVRHGTISLEMADRLQAAALAALAAEPVSVEPVALHPPGQGSGWWYRRRRCRCIECRAHNAQKRMQERARQRPETRPACC